MFEKVNDDARDLALRAPTSAPVHPTQQVTVILPKAPLDVKAAQIDYQTSKISLFKAETRNLTMLPKRRVIRSDATIDKVQL